jgi:hypothetical protein
VRQKGTYRKLIVYLLSVNRLDLKN